MFMQLWLNFDGLRFVLLCFVFGRQVIQKSLEVLLNGLLLVLVRFRLKMFQLITIKILQGESGYSEV